MIGRKNFLFSNTPKGATASAIIYSVIETAMANRLSTINYLTYLFDKLPNIYLNNLAQLDALLPWSILISNGPFGIPAGAPIGKNRAVYGQ